MHYLLHVLTNRFLGFESASAILLMAEFLAFLTLPSILIKRKGQPLAALTWILAVFSLPLLGVFLWWILGRTHLKRIQKFKRYRRVSSQNISKSVEKPGLMSDVISQKLLDQGGGGVFQPLDGNKVSVYSSGEAYFSAIEEAILAAQKEIDVLYYIWKTDTIGTKIRDLLIQKRKEGIRIRVIVDNVGSLSFLGKFGKPLRDAGVEVSGFLPPRFWPWAPTFNFRNHRKLICIDGKISFIGGINIGDEYIHSWRDIAVKIEGPSSSQLEKVFIEDWNFSTKQDVNPIGKGGFSFVENDLCTVIASGPDCDINCSHDIFFQLLSRANEKIWIQTPYFIPPSSITYALRAAVLRGVDVKIILPQENDVKLVGLASKSYYKFLLTSGVQIFEYTKSMLHSKATIVDNYVFLGSSNIDSRSFKLNFELGSLIQSPSAKKRFEEIFLEDISQSSQVFLKDIEGSSKVDQIKESLANLLSPLI